MTMTPVQKIGILVVVVGALAFTVIGLTPVSSGGIVYKCSGPALLMVLQGESMCRSEAVALLFLAGRVGGAISVVGLTIITLFRPQKTG
ncbi:MAG: hypothetical protein AB1673_15320 [Actinomycetota bacterium]